ncbi:MAG: flotillin family protein, partial [Clostridia bacterium]|nr:flotillin family protein [Clostridia bacterium]
MEIAIAVVVIVLLIAICCYRKAPPNEALVITGVGHREPKVVTGRGAIVLPILHRSDRLTMRMMKLDVKTPATGVKTSEGVPLWMDSVVTVQVYSSSSTLTDGEVESLGCKTREQYIKARQQAAISNFLGMDEVQIDSKVNDVLQGNLREIVSEMTVDELLTKRKEFATRVIENARPDLAKVGLEVITFNIQDIQDAQDGCGNTHGVVEAIGVQREMEVKKAAEIARADAERDIALAKAVAAKEANEGQVAADTAIAENNNKLALRRS